MKRSIKTLLEVLAALTVAAASASAQENVSLRERLLNEKSVELLYSIDDFNTYVVGESPVINERSGEFTVVRRDVENGAVLIRHSEAQPFVYKSPVLPSYEEITFPESGELRFNSTEAGGDYRDYTNLDLFEHAYAACKKDNGTPNFLIPRKAGSFKRLTEVSPLDAFNYIVSAENEGGAWEFTCDGDKRFLLSKEYRFSKESFEVATFFPNRGFEGMNYARKDEAQKPSMFAREDNMDRARVIKETAMEVANLRANFVKGRNGSRYEGLYMNSGADGCALVSVRHSGGSVDGIKVYEYKVCGKSDISLRSEKLEEAAKVVKTVRIHHPASAERVIAKAE